MVIRVVVCVTSIFWIINMSVDAHSQDRGPRKKVAFAVEAYKDESGKITRLEVRGEGAGEKVVEMLRTAGAVELVSLAHTHVPRETLTAIAECQALSVLYVLDCEGVRENLEPLSRMVRLESLVLQGLTLADDDLRHLSNLRLLRRLSLERSAITSAAIEHIRGLPQLENLTLFETDIDDEALRTINKLPALNSLLLYNTGITDKGLEHLAGNKTLTYLGLSNTRVTNAGMKSVATLKALKNITLDGTRVDGGGLAALQHMPELEQVVNGPDQFSEEEFWEFEANLPSARRQDPFAEASRLGARVIADGKRKRFLVEFSGAKLTDEIGDILRAMLPGIDTLRFTRTRLTKADIRVLCRLNWHDELDLDPDVPAAKSLRCLDLTDTSLSDDDIDDISTLKALEELKLDDNRISHLSIKKLSVLPELRTLSLRRTPIDDRAVESLFLCRRLERIDLSDTDVTPAGIKALGLAFPKAQIVK